jgi:hypothetical protein
VREWSNLNTIFNLIEIFHVWLGNVKCRCVCWKFLSCHPEGHLVVWILSNMLISFQNYLLFHSCAPTRSFRSLSKFLPYFLLACEQTQRSLKTKFKFLKTQKSFSYGLRLINSTNYLYISSIYRHCEIKHVETLLPNCGVNISMKNVNKEAFTFATSQTEMEFNRKRKILYTK